ncbi:flagellar motor protein MotB [Oleiagrimonas sp. C23AA]|uniref:flagellar motor protein MotB n=1 Tax=Oleiagrimonas sp. C23AA TaxID=2719047 RepID=UPI001421817C|nr:flagellar motor protein MotB [Oleiagrimonas sp. C23AA]
MADEKAPVIIVKRVKKGGGGHHGGAWKVAYADFVTAMMAFFLVMWLLGVGTAQQRAAVSDYFKNPSMTQGTSVSNPSGAMGPGGASNSMIQLGGAMDLPHGPGQDVAGMPKKPTASDAEARAKALEKQRLEDLMAKLHAAIQKSQALEPFKDQLLLDITPEGLRIQIVDKKNRPMFDLGSDKLKSYTVEILHELAGFINAVPNAISITGHTDDAKYGSNKGYSNWELSADRANAARRALVAGGMNDDKVARIVGLAASVPFDRNDPRAPINRRISILVMTKEAAQAARTPEQALQDKAPDKRLPADVHVSHARADNADEQAPLGVSAANKTAHVAIQNVPPGNASKPLKPAPSPVDHSDPVAAAKAVQQALEKAKAEETARGASH